MQEEGGPGAKKAPEAEEEEQVGGVWVTLLVWVRCVRVRCVASGSVCVVVGGGQKRHRRREGGRRRRWLVWARLGFRGVM